jgi:adenosylcobyric acid synthase
MTQPLFTLALVEYPHAADLDEFDGLARVPGVALLRANGPGQLRDAECIVLPGSSDVTADLAWLRRSGLDSAIALHGAARRPVLGVGGGMQLLGEALIDPAAIAGNAPGLGLLPIVSLIEAAGAPTPVQLAFGSVVAHWSPLGGMSVPALELHQGRSVQHQGMGAGRVVLAGGLGWQNAEGNVLGLFARGVFQDAAVLQALFGLS